MRLARNPAEATDFTLPPFESQLPQTCGSERKQMAGVQALLLDEFPQPFDQVQVRRIGRQKQQFDPQFHGQIHYHPFSL